MTYFFGDIWDLIAFIITPIAIIILIYQSFDVASIRKLLSQLGQPERRTVAIAIAMLNNNKRSSIKSIAFAVGLMIATLILYNRGVLSQSVVQWVFSATLLGSLVIFIRHSLLAYRINKGYYATTEYEARAIIQFVLDQSDYYNFSNGDGLNQFDPEREIEIIRKEAAQAGVVL